MLTAYCIPAFAAHPAPHGGGGEGFNRGNMERNRDEVYRDSSFVSPYETTEYFYNDPDYVDTPAIDNPDPDSVDENSSVFDNWSE